MRRGLRCGEMLAGAVITDDPFVSGIDEPFVHFIWKQTRLRYMLGEYGMKPAVTFEAAILGQQHGAGQIEHRIVCARDGELGMVALEQQFGCGNAFAGFCQQSFLFVGHTATPSSRTF